MRAQRSAVRQLPLLALAVPGVTMQTRGFRMDGLYEGGSLAHALEDARSRTLALYAHVDLERPFPLIDIVNPPHWELAHIAWFQEHWCLRGGDRTRETLLPRADALFDSSAIPHDARWQLDYPPVARLKRYMQDTLEATLEGAVRAQDPQARYFFELSLLHEDMHGEALAMTLQTLGLPAPGFATPAAASTSPGAPARDIAFDGGDFLQGTRRDAAHFVFDNEKWAHRVTVEPFSMSNRAVTQGEFRAFVEDRGYEDERLWTPAGRAWLRKAGRRAPRDWRRSGGGSERRVFDRWGPLDAAAPMLHVTLHEALAYCDWAGRRLPTESEWEFAATNGGRPERYPWEPAELARADLEMRHVSPRAAGSDAASPRGLHGLIGGVWEWTVTAFAPYPEFAPDPYRDYSQPWFHTHGVLRGGSFATRARLPHSRFRNFYMAHRDDVFAGFRTCAR
jgi:gamma-glutamyl hercynylcysteine S-oxide synthase